MTKSVIRQHDIWTKGSAADDYFSRNASRLDAKFKKDNRSLNMFCSFIRNGDRVLEIGCANGATLAAIQSATSCDGYGIDPSSEAIKDGCVKHPSLKLSVGSAEKLEFEDHYFHAIIFGFCLYLVDRSVLMKVVSESDRMLRDGGYLMITDFDPILPHRRPYKHFQDAFTYKMSIPTFGHQIQIIL